MPGELTIVVVAFGADDLLEACLSPITPNLRVVVVDNAARPTCRDLCEVHGAEYVDGGGNRGFAGGVNLALERVSGDVLLLNPDARLTSNDVGRLHSALRASDDLACVAPAQEHPVTGETQRVAWPFPSPARRWVEALGLGRHINKPEFLIGSALLISADALREVGPFDERFFLYCEETDWQRRAHALGWRVRSVPEVTAHHVGAGTSTDSTVREAYFHAAHELYIRKWFGSRGWQIYRAACLCGDAIRIASGGGRARAARARFAIYREGPVHHRDTVLMESGR